MGNPKKTRPGRLVPPRGTFDGLMKFGDGFVAAVALIEQVLAGQAVQFAQAMDTGIIKDVS